MCYIFNAVKLLASLASEYWMLLFPFYVKNAFFHTFINSNYIYKNFSCARVLFSNFQTSPMISTSPASTILNEKVVVIVFHETVVSLFHFDLY